MQKIISILILIFPLFANSINTQIDSSGRNLLCLGAGSLIPLGNYQRYTSDIGAAFNLQYCYLSKKNFGFIASVGYFGSGYNKQKALESYKYLITDSLRYSNASSNSNYNCPYFAYGVIYRIRFREFELNPYVQIGTGFFNHPEENFIAVDPNTHKSYLWDILQKRTVGYCQIYGAKFNYNSIKRISIGLDFHLFFGGTTQDLKYKINEVESSYTLTRQEYFNHYSAMFSFNYRLN